MPSKLKRHGERDPAAVAVVRELPVARDDAALLSGLIAGEPWAKAGFFDRYAPTVKRVLRRVLGPRSDPELPDLVHDVFVEALRSIGTLRDPGTFGGWMQSIAAHVALGEIRRRRRRAWLRFWEPAALDLVASVQPVAEARRALMRTYAVLDLLDAEGRVAFALRHIEGLELVDVAAACHVSLATIKRRLQRAEKRFGEIASRDPVLASWLNEGVRWTKT